MSAGAARESVASAFGIRRIISNTSTVITWSSDTATPGAGAMSWVGGSTYTYEIGNVGWRWLCKSETNPQHLTHAMELDIQFDAISASQTIGVSDVVDNTALTSVEARKPEIYTAKELAVLHEANRASREYTVLLTSRTGAVIRNVSLMSQVEESSK